MVGNDLSVRDWQLRSPTTTIGKSFDTHGPIGPWITTRDGDPRNPGALLGLGTFVNGEQRRRPSTATWCSPSPEQIEHLSTAFTLEPGDLALHGHPRGVGLLMKPPQYSALVIGSASRFDGLGAIENEIIAEPGQPQG